jgi:hypothetical protein
MKNVPFNAAGAVRAMVPVPVLAFNMAYVPVTCCAAEFAAAVLWSWVPLIAWIPSNVSTPEISRSALVGGMEVPSMKVPLIVDALKGPVD